MQNLMLLLNDRLVEAEREKCLPTIQRIVELCCLVRASGALALEAEGHTGTPLLERLIIAEGVLAVQRGENPVILATRLGAMLGETYLEQAKQAAQDSMNVMMPWDYIRILSQKEALPESAIFADKFQRFHWRSLYIIIKNTNHHTLVSALSGCGGGLLHKVWESVSNNTFTQICQDMIAGMNNGAFSKEYVLDAQKTLLENAQTLKNAGEIFY